VADLLAYAPFGFGVAAAVLAMVFDAWGDRVSAVIGAAALLFVGGLAAVWTALATGVQGSAVRSGGMMSIAPAACLLLGAVVLGGDGGARMDRLLGGAGHDPRSRLGLAVAAPDSDVREAAVEELGRWQRQAEHPLSDRQAQIAARVTVRTLEGLLSKL